MTSFDNKYKEEYADSVADMFALGEDVAEVAHSLGVSRQTFYAWVKKYPKFAEGYELGKQASEAWWCKLGRAGATGKVAIQPTVWIFNMKNKFNWKDKIEQELTGKDGGPIETKSIVTVYIPDNGRN